VIRARFGRGGGRGFGEGGLSPVDILERTGRIWSTVRIPPASSIGGDERSPVAGWAEDEVIRWGKRAFGGDGQLWAGAEKERAVPKLRLAGGGIAEGAVDGLSRCLRLEDCCMNVALHSPAVPGHSPVYIPTATNMLHTYNGTVRLSFCPLTASTIPPAATTAAYLPVENTSAYPAIRITHAHPITDTQNAMLPSTVLPLIPLHRCPPTRFPTIDANASPTPSTNIPVYDNSRVGLYISRQLQDHTSRR